MIPFHRFHARTYIGLSGNREVGRNVFQHCQIVGSAAAELVARMLLTINTQIFTKGSSLVAACHDIGKFIPTFAKNILRNTSGWKPEHTPKTIGQNHGFTPPGDMCRAYVLAPELRTLIIPSKQAFESTVWVYSPSVLGRSLEVLKKRQCLCLPDGSRPLIEITYQKCTEAERMSQWLHELMQGNGLGKGQRALKQSARITLASNGKTLPESKVQTRYSDEDNVEVLLLQTIDLALTKKSVIYYCFMDVL